MPLTWMSFETKYPTGIFCVVMNSLHYSCFCVFYSRLLFGWLADRNESFRFVLGATMLTLGGVVSALMPLFSSYSLMIVYSALFGMFTGE